MKKILALAIALTASSALAAVVGTPHDLTALPGNTATGSCQYCHMPHHSNPGATGAPIWAKTVSSAYTLYGTTVGGQTPTAIGPVSQACLSCHDGTANAVTTQHTGATLATNYTINGGVANGTNVGTDISNDHPVSIPYPTAAGGQAGLVSRANAVTAGFLFFGAGADQMECGTCHDPHNQPAEGFFLRGGAGDFCAKCHATK
jgi:predicted CXXCH cytochrome family protein